MVVMTDETLSLSLSLSLVPKEILEVTEGMVKELQVKLYKLRNKTMLSQLLNIFCT